MLKFSEAWIVLCSRYGRMRTHQVACCGPMRLGGSAFFTS